MIQEMMKSILLVDQQENVKKTPKIISYVPFISKIYVKKDFHIFKVKRYKSLKIVYKQTTPADDKHNLKQLSLGHKRLKQLNLHFLTREHPTNTEIAKLEKSIVLFSNTDKLCLEILEIQGYKVKACITSKRLTRFMKCLLKMKKLKVLQLNIAVNKISDPKSLYQLAKSLKTLLNLQTIRLRTDGIAVTDSSLSEIGFSFCTLPRLVEIDLNISDDPFLTDQGLVIFSDLISQTENLLTLNLNLKYCKSLTNEGLFGLAKVLPYMESLRELSIGFRGNPNVQNKGLGALTDYLPQIQNLKSLSLMFPLCNSLTGEGIIEGIKGLRRLEKLVRLDLSFSSSNNIGNNEVGWIGKIVKDIKTLKELVLDFRFCPQITDHGLVSLGESIKDLHLLKSVSLSFYLQQGNIIYNGKKPVRDLKQFNEMTDDGISKMVQSLASIKELQEVMIIYNKGKLLSNHGLEMIGKALSAAEKIKKIRLSFHFCTNLTASGVQAFIDAIATLPLQELALELYETRIPKDQKFVLSSLPKGFRCSIEI